VDYALFPGRELMLRVIRAVLADLGSAGYADVDDADVLVRAEAAPAAPCGWMWADTFDPFLVNWVFRLHVMAVNSLDA